MVNGKYPWLVGLLVLLYAGWVALSGYFAHATTFSWSAHDQKVARIQSMDSVDALIVGGSNAVFSLSAAELSAQTGKSWFNAALLSEGFTFENQRKFLDVVAESIDPDRVETVVLSSVRHFHRGLDDKMFLTGLGYDGLKVPPVWLPYRSLASLADKPLKPIFPTVISEQGDLLYEESRLCTNHRPAGRIEWAPNAEIDVMLGAWLPVLRSTFPAADIVVTIPGQYLTDPVDEVAGADYVARLTDRIAAWQSSQSPTPDVEISVILEPNYTDQSIVCNMGHHFNAIGRSLRTSALADGLATNSPGKD